VVQDSARLLSVAGTKCGFDLRFPYKQLGDHLEAKRVGSQSGENSVTRCMIFCSFREGVNELVVCPPSMSRSLGNFDLTKQLLTWQEMLNKHPLIRAHKFVGRANGKDITDKGLTQAEQKSVSSLVALPSQTPPDGAPSLILTSVIR